MTPDLSPLKGPRPGAHNIVEGQPRASAEFIADPEGWQPVFAPDGTVTEAFRASLREYVDGELLSQESPIGTPASEARERRMQNPEYAREARTLTVRFTYLRKGHPRAALEAVLRSISPAVFETEILDA